MRGSLLPRRAELLTRLREFFTTRGFHEVQTPTVDPEIIPEAHIDPYYVEGLGYLQASPEMHLKRLLCHGAGPLVEIKPCFRAGERGRLHRPEFTLVEWYRPGDDMQSAIELLNDLLSHLAGTGGLVLTSYREAFVRHAEFDPFEVPISTLEEMSRDGDIAQTRDEWLNYYLATRVESQLGLAGPEVLYHYPASQSSLAATTFDTHGTQVAERFELYWQGIELANGYHELTDAAELRARLVEANHQRQETGRPPLPLPEALLTAMENPGLPPCAGVALGFDRLAMLLLGATSIDEVMV